MSDSDWQLRDVPKDDENERKELKSKSHTPRSRSTNGYVRSVASRHESHKQTVNSKYNDLNIQDEDLNDLEGNDMEGNDIEGNDIDHGNESDIFEKEDNASDDGKGGSEIVEKLISTRRDHEPGRPLSESEKSEIGRIMSKVNETFKGFSETRDSDLLSEGNLLNSLVKEGLEKDLELMDKIDTENIFIYSSITRQRLRMTNSGYDIIKAKYLSEGFNIIGLCTNLIERSSTALGYEDEKLHMMIKILELVLKCFEYGLFPIQSMRMFLKSFFQKTEFINKQEEYISSNHEVFEMKVFDKLMICKSLSARILLQIVTFINDDWFYHFISEKQVDELILEEKEEFNLCKRKKKKEVVVKDHNVFLCDSLYYSHFSFIMFNYLLKELRKGEKLLTDKQYLHAMNNLILYVYDYREDPFILSLELMKFEYLNYYIDLNIEEDQINRGDAIIKMVLELRKKFIEEKGLKEKPKNKDEEGLEQDVSNIFGELEILMGLQDETYSIRLMLTEKKMPELLIEIFVSIQESYIGDSADELFIQGLKVLYQLCKGNYPGQAQITKGSGWLNFRKLITGKFSVFNILFLKQLFEEDPKYLHINKDFAIELIDLFNETFDLFFKSFTTSNLIRSAKDLVSLYSFKQLISLFLKTTSIPHKIRQSYNLPVSNILHRMVDKFALPLFKENYLEFDKIYEPKLITKNWKLEDGSFLVSLMMLSGNHIKCMLVDFAFSLIGVYNKSCEYYYPSTFYDEMYKGLPFDMSVFEYLTTFSEGIKFKTEILNSYCIFKIFSQSSKIPDKYTPSELSLDGVDTNLDFLPDNHLRDLPDMIINEIKKLEVILHEKINQFEREELTEYILRGICQMVYKYANGIIWYFLSTEKEDIKNELGKKLNTMNDRLTLVVKLVVDDRLKTPFKLLKKKPSEKLKAFIQDSQSGITDRIGGVLVKLIENVEAMLAGSPYEDILGRYDLNLNHVQLDKLGVAKKLLKCEVKYLISTKMNDRDIPPEDVDEDNQADHYIAKTLIINYKRLKKLYLRDKKKNKFYEILQSKMEDMNQFNLVSFVCEALDSIEYNSWSYKSLWFDRNSMNIITFLNNTMYWCPKTRIKFYEFLKKHPVARTKLISIIYKGLRDTFSILAYSPFINEHWEIIYSKFYIFTSFIEGLCKQNCQDFKKFLGEFKPSLKCSNHMKKDNSVLIDLSSVLTKFLNFSGISFNKGNKENPSDRLSTIMITESIMRCIIDMLTGPCEPNQLKIYNKGNIIWLSVFNRTIEDLDSKYYDLMNIVLDYLLSLLEGNNSHILAKFSTTFDIPVMYILMTKLMAFLWRRIQKKRRKELMIKNSEEVRSKKDGNLQGSKLSLGSKDSSLALFGNERNSQTKDIEEYKMDSWTDLISMYMNGDFENHVALSCSIKIFTFLSRVAYESKKYQIYFDIKESQLTNELINAGFKQEDIRQNKVYLKGKTKATEELIVYYFMKNITSRVEIRDEKSNAEIFIFPKRPMCFFLRETTKNNFQETCQIDNTEAKLLDMFDSFQQFFLEMQSHQRFKSQYRFIGKFATDKSFKYMRILCYLLSIVINFLLLYDIEIYDFIVYTEFSDLPVLILSILLIFFCAIGIALWAMSNYNVAWLESYRKFTVQHPYRNPYQPVNLMIIMYEVLVRKDVVSFVIHFFIAILGISYSRLVQVCIIL